MKRSSLSVFLGLSVGCLPVLVASAAAPGTYTLRIAVDQFGYLPDMSKVAVISDPQVGFNAAESYTPGPTLEVRSWPAHTVVFSGSPVAWSNGITHVESGDRIWWFDFSAVNRWGEYYIYDPSADLRSARFVISPKSYEEVLRHAARTFYYQRRGMAKVEPYADVRWVDGTNFMRALQDTQCRHVTNTVPATQKDLRGGWFDAGDYNKYVNFTLAPVSDLVMAFRQNPLAWPDDWGIPESGNGVPDLLDELKWELDWLLRMQNANGSVLSKMGVNAFQGASPPSAEASQIFYGSESTTASLTAAGNFAQAVRAYEAAGLGAYANTLSNAAVLAYNWAVANPNVIFDNTGFASANPEVNTADYAYERDRLRIRAAIFLYEITGQSSYRTYVEANYTALHPLLWTWWNVYDAQIQDALLLFTTLPGVSSTVVNTIRNSKQNSINGGDFMGAWTSGRDAYRSYFTDATYHWGSNMNKARTGILFYNQLTFNLNPAQAVNYRAAAGGYLHYLHGVNPLTLAYVANMYAYGADNCVNEFYHSWFAHGTIYDNALSSPRGPAPGYVPGGPNKNFAPDPSYSGPPLVPPMSQPIQKSYKDWNTSWPENSWEITEPAIYYQSAYVHLLSRFVRPLTYADWASGNGLTGPAADRGADGDGDGVANLFEYAFDLSPLVDDRASLPQFRLLSHTVNGQPGTYLTVTFPRQMGSTNLTYQVQASSNLTSWINLCSAAGTNAPTGTGLVAQAGTHYLRQLTARDIVPVEEAATPRYVRFQLVWNP